MSAEEVITILTIAGVATAIFTVVVLGIMAWQRRVAPPEDPLDDPAVMKAVVECFKTGNIVYGSRRPDGTWDIKSVPRRGEDDETT